MTHCAGYRAAALARAKDVAAIGIDAEPNATLPDGVLAAVSTAEERRLLQTVIRTRPCINWDRLLFSAKEAAFKAWFPLTGRKLGVESTAIRISVVGSFVALLRVDESPVIGQRFDRLHGRWLVSEGLTVTAIVIPASCVKATAGERTP
jgi:4'-phosphopantetheinyl transferase EntD